MTFLSLTPEALAAAPAPARLALLRQRPRASFAGQVAAIAIVTAGMTVPGAVAQAKWTKLALIATIVQHRCMTAVSD